jgi:hypothetical protein
VHATPSRRSAITNPKGTKLETDTVNWLRTHGWTWARRLVKEGNRDKGDVTLGDGFPVTIECKNEKSMNISGAQKELKVEMANAGHKWGFAVHKKRGTTNVGEYYAVLPVEVLMDILDAALRHATSADQVEQPQRKGTLTSSRRVIRQPRHTSV